jgi:acetyl-CoA carboxylase carboxyl transferase subunit alpha
MLAQGLIDGIIKEPLGGAHKDPTKAIKNVKSEIKKLIKELSAFTPEERIDSRIDKFCKMGEYAN